MDKVILSILSEKVGSDVPYKTHMIGGMLLVHKTMIRHFRLEVEGEELSEKQVQMLFDWSNSYLKKLDEYKSRFYPTHLNVAHIFKGYCDELKKLKGKSRAFLERDMRRTITEGTLASIAKAKEKGDL